MKIHAQVPTVVTDAIVRAERKLPDGIASHLQPIEHVRLEVSPRVALVVGGLAAAATAAATFLLVRRRRSRA